MDVEHEDIAMAWEGPVGDAEIPDEILYHVRLKCAIHDRAQAAEAVATHLSAIAGPARRSRWPGFVLLRFRKPPYNLDVKLRKNELRLLAFNRLKPNALNKVVEAVGHVPGASSLWIDATVPRFSKSCNNLRACTPCQAAQMR